MPLLASLKYRDITKEGMLAAPAKHRALFNRACELSQLDKGKAMEASGQAELQKLDSWLT